MFTRRSIDRCTDTRLALSDEEIREVAGRVGLAGHTDRHITVATLIGVPMVILIGSGGGLLLLNLLQVIGLTKGQAMWVAGLGLPMVLIVVWFVVFAWMYKRLIRRALVDCGHPVCIGCGYLLEGVAGEVCPECGRACGGD